MISVIIPFYNDKQYIKRCLDCFLAQTSKNFELILINDGSQEDSQNIINAYKRKINIRYYSYKEHKGVSAARNLGISKVKGNIIGFCDIDDLFNKEMIETIEKSFTTSHCELVVTGVSRIENDKLDIKEFLDRQYSNILLNSISKKEFLYKILFDKRIYGSVWNKFFKKELITEKFDENVSIFEDLLFIFANTYYKNISIQLIDAPLYGYINNSTSITRNISNLYDKKNNNKYLIILELIKQKYAVKDFGKKINSKIFDMAFSTITNGDYVNDIQKRKLINKCWKSIKNYIFENTYTYRHRVKFTCLFLKTYLLSYLIK